MSSLEDRVEELKRLQQQTADLIDAVVKMVAQPQQLELPLWDDRVHVEGNIAWRMIGGHRVEVSSVDADLLEDKGLVGSNNKTTAILVRTVATSGGRSNVETVVRRAKSLGALVLQRSVGPAPVGHTCDHYPDINPLNNRRENLRWASQSQQSRNRRVYGSSRYLYVSLFRWADNRTVYRYAKAQVRGTDGKIHRGRSHRVDLIADAEIMAARDGDAIALSLYGPGARTNVSLGLLPQPQEQLTLPLEPSQ